MNNFNTNVPLLFGILLSLTLGFAQVSMAQSPTLSTDKNSEQISPDNKLNNTKPELSAQLEELSLVVQKKTKDLNALKAREVKPENKAELENTITLASQQLDTLNKSFEQLAIGNINLDTINTKEPDLSWQEELTLAVKPLLENLRGLTEEPRKRESLRQLIALQKSTLAKAQKALNSIDELLINEPSESQKNQLKLIRTKWLLIKENSEREQQLALYQLESLSGDNSRWFVSLKKTIVTFVRERGATLALAILVSVSIWLLMSGLRKLLSLTGSRKTKHSNRTTYRIVAYAQRLLTAMLIIIGILTVFFVRGDILLLVISLALLFAAALGLKNFLPQFIAESRLLLNVGGVREHEQIIINDVPWRVASINLFSKFTNPEIQGTLRLPLSALKDLSSRPIKDEKWFPSSIGDWVLDGDNRLYEVIKQTPISVELQSAQGTNKLVPTAAYYSAGFVNLTKSKQIRITSRFGIAYELQNIALTVVPDVFKEAVSEHLSNASLDTNNIEVRVEFASAGESSLDYLIIAHIDSVASKYFYRIERVIQQACVDACNKQNWGIPFPQLTVHHLPVK